MLHYLSRHILLMSYLMCLPLSCGAEEADYLSQRTARAGKTSWRHAEESAGRKAFLTSRHLMK